MHRTKVWLGSALVVGLMMGTFVFVGIRASHAQPSPREERREERNYWRHHEGRWSHWDARDRRWYYTDGSHWYYHNGSGWNLYRFDKTFGREGFERGGYVPPPANVEVVVPNHRIYVGPR